MGKKKKKDDDAPPAAGWLVSYADLMTLLFTAFVVLWALKKEGSGENDAERKAMASMIREAFTVIPDEIPDVESEEPTEESKVVFTFFRGETATPPITQKFRRSDKAIPVINRDMQKVVDKIEIILNEKKRPDIDPTPDKEKPISVLPDKDGFTVRLLSSYFFKSGEYKLNKEAYQQVVEIGKTLRELDKKIRIEGHTDGRPSEGTFSNWELSSLRAGAIAKVFLKENKFDPSRVSTAGYAETRPIATNRTAQGRKLNRRVEIRVEYDE